MIEWLAVAVAKLGCSAIVAVVFRLGAAAGWRIEIPWPLCLLLGLLVVFGGVWVVVNLELDELPR